MKLPNIALWDAFTDGHTFATWDGGTSTRIADAGSLVLPTGRIVVSDPLLDPWNKPFTVAVPPGTYSVLLSLIDGDVGLVMVHFAEGTPVRWQRTKPRSFIVDSARGCVMDYKACRFLRRQSENDKYEKYARRFEDALEPNGLWGSYCLDSESGLNVILFHTHSGDGVFPSFFGYNAEDEVICLITDMFLYRDNVLRSAQN